MMAITPTGTVVLMLPKWPNHPTANGARAKDSGTVDDRGWGGATQPEADRASKRKISLVGQQDVSDKESDGDVDDVEVFSAMVPSPSFQSVGN